MSFSETPKYNGIEKYCNVVFTVLCNNKDAIDKNTGIPRHDLIGGILCRHFNWSNIFGNQCKLVKDQGSVTDTNFITRTLILNLLQQIQSLILLIILQELLIMRFIHNG